MTRQSGDCKRYVIRVLREVWFEYDVSVRAVLCVVAGCWLLLWWCGQC